MFSFILSIEGDKIMFRRIVAIAKKEFRQVGRDKRSLGILVFIPAFMLLMFGYAVDFDVRDIALAVYDEDNSSQSRELIDKFIHSGYFGLRYRLDSPDEIDRLLDREVVRVAIVIPHDFSERLTRGLDVPVQVLIDGANASAAATVMGYVNTIIQSYSVDLLADTRITVEGGAVTQPIDFHPRIWYNPELRSPVFLIPGLIAFILMVTSSVATSLSIVREKELGTMEQIAVSPVHPAELIVGKIMPYVFTSILSTVLIILGGYILFGVGVAGSFLLLAMVVLLFLFVALAWGLIISTTSDTQQVAFMKALTTTLLPTFILSGFVFPIHNMPVAIQAVTYIVPARYFLEALRAIMVKGVGLAVFWEQIVALVIFGFVLVIASTVRMKKHGYAA
jgi:ABC-2 type transport system permease protein